jgi:hypothetical protein
LKFNTDGTYTGQINGEEPITGSWKTGDGILVLTGIKVLDDSQKNLIDAAETYKIEWLGGRKRFKLEVVSASANGKVLKHHNGGFVATYD